MTWEELLRTNHQEVIVTFNSYIQPTILGPNFIPLASERVITFKIKGRTKLLTEHLEVVNFEKLYFELKGNKIFLHEPEVWARL